MMLNTASTTPYRKALGVALAGFVSLAAASAVWAANPPEEQRLVRPIWVQKPGGEDMARYYPAEAMKAGVNSATAVMNCRVAANGRLRDCVVLKEDPAQYGFGEAMLKLSRHFQMAPEDRDGQPTAGGAITIPIMFLNTES